MKTQEQLKLENIMGYCYGTEHYYRNDFLPFLYTDGVKTFVENAGVGAFWFLNECAVITRKIEEFSSIILKVKDDKADILLNGHQRKHIPYTDCPEGEWSFFYEPEQKLLLWNGEY